MINVYELCPYFESNNFLVRQLDDKDLDHLFKVYSDKNAVPFFNGDNCHGDNFYYDTIERMQKAIDFWDCAYKNGWFVRWSIVAKRTKEIIGTVEAFHREAKDLFTNACLIRLDLRSDFEKESNITEILRLLEKSFFSLFDCDKLVTKDFAKDMERIKALTILGFAKASEPLVGEYGEFFDYWIKPIK